MCNLAGSAAGAAHTHTYTFWLTRLPNADRRAAAAVASYFPGESERNYDGQVHFGFSEKQERQNERERVSRWEKRAEGGDKRSSETERDGVLGGRNEEADARPPFADSHAPCDSLEFHPDYVLLTKLSSAKLIPLLPLLLLYTATAAAGEWIFLLALERSERIDGWTDALRADVIKYFVWWRFPASVKIFISHPRRDKFIKESCRCWILKEVNAQTIYLSAAL